MESKTSNMRYMLFVALSAGLLHLVNSKCSMDGSPFRTYDTSGTIQSPGYPDRYYGNEECDWEINAPIGKTPELMIVRIDRVETEAPEWDVDCGSPNFVDIGPIRVCGNESSICVACMLGSTTHMSCHDKVAEKYPGCSVILFKEWPFKVSFRTLESSDDAGFKLDYNIVDCHDQAPTPLAVAESTESVTIQNDLPNDPSTPVIETSKSTETSSTEKSGSVGKSNMDNKQLTLTVTIVVLGVVLLAMLLLVVFRKQIRAWATRKTGSEVGSSSNGEACIVSIDESLSHERHVADSKISADENNMFTTTNGDLNQNQSKEMNGHTNGHANGDIHSNT